MSYAPKLPLTGRMRHKVHLYMHALKDLHENKYVHIEINII